MTEYEDLGHMRRVSNPPLTGSMPVYIPHHPVFRADSVTSHLRVVFNGSHVSSNGSTLNDHLLAGPKLQSDLPSIILQWRQFKFVYSADIAKMYRQILIDQHDLDFQRIRWQSDSDAIPHDYQLLTLTYGMTCASFLALRVLKCLADDEGARYPAAAQVVRQQIYVDDVLFGADDVNSLRLLRDQLVSLLRCGGFELRKWASNEAALLADIDPNNHGLACNKSNATDEQIEVLGIIWNPARDVFQFKVVFDKITPTTKRQILSTIARLYDPLGWVIPVTVSAKIIMQHLWRLQISWDAPAPDSILVKWQQFYTKLSYLNDISIPRWTERKVALNLSCTVLPTRQITPMPLSFI